MCFSLVPVLTHPLVWAVLTHLDSSDNTGLNSNNPPLASIDFVCLYLELDFINTSPSLYSPKDYSRSLHSQPDMHYSSTQARKHTRARVQFTELIHKQNTIQRVHTHVSAHIFSVWREDPV